MGRIFLKIYSFFFFFGVLFDLATSPVFAADWGGNCVVNGVATIQGLECVFSNVVQVILALSSIVLFIMFIIGGFKYLTAGGDPKAIESARGTLTYAIAGLVVLIFAFLILIILANITGIQSITHFKIRTD